MADRLAVEPTPISGLLVVRMPVPQDNRGWFKENWQREKMVALGVPDFEPVQQNMSYNERRGATRGIHAEPWDKLVSVAHGRVFGAWVDLREGPGFGTVHTAEIGPDTAVFVPRGVGNAYQTLTDDVTYSYLVNDHWSAAARAAYVFVNLADPRLAIRWPFPLDDVEVSDADRTHPSLDEVTPIPRRRTLVVGQTGQLARSLARLLPDADFVSRPRLDLVDLTSIDTVEWRDYDLVINAAAYTDVDGAETPEGRRTAWTVNVEALKMLAARVRRVDATFVHVSSDYVFDGTRPDHTEDETFSPLGVYGQTKAAGDAVVSTLPRHYLLRTSWVVGDGKNFVRTMSRLADDGVSPAVIDDQVGRLTFSDDLARGIDHLVRSVAPFGTYNLSGGGAPTSWADVARSVFAARGREPADITPVTTEQYVGDRTGVAPRPRQSTLDLGKIRAAGFEPRDASESLAEYLETV